MNQLRTYPQSFALQSHTLFTPSTLSLSHRPSLAVPSHSLFIPLSPLRPSICCPLRSLAIPSNFLSRSFPLLSPSISHSHIPPLSPLHPHSLYPPLALRCPSASLPSILSRLSNLIPSSLHLLSYVRPPLPHSSLSFPQRSPCSPVSLLLSLRVPPHSLYPPLALLCPNSPSSQFPLIPSTLPLLSCVRPPLPQSSSSFPLPSTCPPVSDLHFLTVPSHSLYPPLVLLCPTSPSSQFPLIPSTLPLLSCVPPPLPQSSPSFPLPSTCSPLSLSLCPTSPLSQFSLIPSILHLLSSDPQHGRMNIPLAHAPDPLLFSHPLSLAVTPHSHFPPLALPRPTLCHSPFPFLT